MLLDSDVIFEFVFSVKISYLKFTNQVFFLDFRYVEKCKFPKDGSSSKSLRYIGRYKNCSEYLFRVF